MAFGNDDILWYNPKNLPWGKLGYACPNFGRNVYTLNDTIEEFVNVIGRNLSAVMHHRDAALRTPPSINTLIRVHKLIIRARQLLTVRSVPYARPSMEPTHDTPAKKPFILYPCPYWNVRNGWLRPWGGLVLQALGEACQHTENAKQFEITPDFAGTVAQYLQRVYVRLSTELLMVPLADASKPDFTLTDVHFGSYDPSKWFTQTELIDLVPEFENMPTEEDLRVLTEGIPAPLIVGLDSYPVGGPAALSADKNGVADGTDVKAAAVQSTGSFAPAPAP